MLFFLYYNPLAYYETFNARDLESYKSISFIRFLNNNLFATNKTSLDIPGFPALFMCEKATPTAYMILCNTGRILRKVFKTYHTVLGAVVHPSA